MEEKQLRQTEVGIVSPYYKQVQKIRMVLREKHLRDIKVGSVAEFQGKEYKALFISTVRASRHWYSSLPSLLTFPSIFSRTLTSLIYCRYLLVILNKRLFGRF